jgi:uncharacterized Fe-S center protein
MKKVYFKAIDAYSKTQAIRDGAKDLVHRLIDDHNIQLEPMVPLKVHFGEKGNTTFIEPKNFEGIIEYLHAQQVESCFMETNALYRGERTTRAKHIQVAQAHGFTQLPIVIADGEFGDEYEHVEINQKHFKTCKIGKAIAQQQQLIVVSHFKGHILTGFGGAIKQLAMGCAARGGKLDQHSGAHPIINPFTCKKCQTCTRHCPVDAIRIGRLPRIQKTICIGCASCIAVCPYGAIFYNPLSSLTKSFLEKLAEYAFAAQKNKCNIYLTFALNMTRGCDCEGHPMKPVIRDLGLFASIDPVAIDQACLDRLDQRAGKKVFRRGRYILEYGQKIGLGNKVYELIEVNGHDRMRD